MTTEWRWSPALGVHVQEDGLRARVLAAQQVKGPRNWKIELAAEHLRKPVVGWLDVREHPDLRDLLTTAKEEERQVAYACVLHRQRAVAVDKAWTSLDPQTETLRDVVWIGPPGTEPPPRPADAVVVPDPKKQPQEHELVVARLEGRAAPPQAALPPAAPAPAAPAAPAPAAPAPPPPAAPEPPSPSVDPLVGLQALQQLRQACEGNVRTADLQAAVDAALDALPHAQIHYLLRRHVPLRQISRLKVPQLPPGTPPWKEPEEPAQQPLDEGPVNGQVSRTSGGGADQWQTPPAVVGEHVVGLDEDGSDAEVGIRWRWACSCGEQGEWTSESAAAARHLSGAHLAKVIKDREQRTQQPAAAAPSQDETRRRPMATQSGLSTRPRRIEDRQAWEPYNIDSQGRSTPNPASWQYGHVNRMVVLAAKMCSTWERELAEREERLPVEPGQERVGYLASKLLLSADHADRAVHGETRRKANGYRAATDAVREALDLYPPPFGEPKEEWELWQKQVTERAVMLLRVTYQLFEQPRGDDTE